MVGSLSSITALIQIAGSTARVATDIIRRFQDAPEELYQLSRKLSLLYSELNFINNLEQSTSGDDLAPLPKETEDPWKALQTAKALMLDVQKACHRKDGKSQAHARFCWVFHDQAKIKDIVSRLQEIRMSLHTILLLVNV